MKRFLKTAFSFLIFFVFVSSISVDTYAVGPWTHNGIIVDKVSPQPENTSIKLTANVSGDTSGLQYKFVWVEQERVGSSWGRRGINWGVIGEDYSPTNYIYWTPTKAGNYTLYLGVRDQNDRVKIRELNYKII